MPRPAITTIKVLLCLGIAALAVALAPALPARAQAESDPGTPPAPADTGGARLERAWLRMQRRCGRLGFMFNHVQRRIDHAEELIDRAQANGKNVARLESALAAFSEAVADARPTYEGAKGIIASHKGFDANGDVLDPESAAETVKELGQKLEEIGDILRHPARELADALREFRRANRPN